MKRDIDNPEMPCEVMRQSSDGCGGDIRITFATSWHVRGTVGPYKGRYGIGGNPTVHVLTITKTTTREHTINALLGAARALGWRGDLPDAVVVEHDKGSATYHPRRERYQPVRLYNDTRDDVLECKP